MGSNLTRNFILFFVALFVLKSAMNAGLFRSYEYKGPGFTVTIPLNWEVDEDEKKGDIYAMGERVVFVPEKLDPKTGAVPAKIIITARKLESSMWIEDEFPSILASLARQGMKILENGEIKISDEISRWVLYHDKQGGVLNLVFHVVTQGNMYYKIYYVTSPKNFPKFRQDFESMRETFTLKFML